MSSTYRRALYFGDSQSMKPLVQTHIAKRKRSKPLISVFLLVMFWLLLDETISLIHKQCPTRTGHFEQALLGFGESEEWEKASFTS